MHSAFTFRLGPHSPLSYVQSVADFRAATPRPVVALPGPLLGRHKLWISTLRLAAGSDRRDNQASTTNPVRYQAIQSIQPEPSVQLSLPRHAATQLAIRKASA